jgi:signal transduction histidine kinase
VDDDGVGVSGSRAPSGLENARARAVALGGELQLSVGPLGGARLLWRVPLSR